MKARRDSDQEIRAAMAVISGVAKLGNCAIVGIGHTNKKKDLNGIDKFSGVGAFTQFARQILFACLEDEDEKDGPRRLSHTGGNLGAVPDDLLFEPEPKGDSVAIGWKAAPYSQTVAELFGARTSKSNPVGSWLIGLLVIGPRPREEVLATGKAIGYSESTIKRHFGKLEEAGTAHSTVTGFGIDKRAVWSLAAAGSEPIEPIEPNGEGSENP